MGSHAAGGLLNHLGSSLLSVPISAHSSQVPTVMLSPVFPFLPKLCDILQEVGYRGASVSVPWLLILAGPTNTIQLRLSHVGSKLPQNSMAWL